MIAEEFKRRRYLYEQLVRAVRPLLQRLAADHGVEVALIEDRVKEQDSLEHKIGRPDKAGKYEKLDDITDLCGLRIVLFTNEDCVVMSEAISQNFTIDLENSVVKSDSYSDDRFGYLSTHLIASLPQNRVALFEFRHLADLKMEIQIRTVLQHAWAVLDWKLRYKTEKEVPRELRRKLFRISALLEAADEAFSDLQLSAVNLRSEYDKDIRTGKFGIPLNRDSLQSFLSQSVTASGVIERCKQRGIEIHGQGIRGPDTAYDNLISSLLASDIATIDQFEERLRNVSDQNIDELVAIANSGKFGFGIFTPLRILMVSQLNPSRQLQVVTSVPTGGPIGNAERAYFKSKNERSNLGA